MRAPWPPWLRGELSIRTPNVVEKLWVRSGGRAKRKYEAIQALQVEREGKRQRVVEAQGHRDAEHRSQEGGFVGKGADRRRIGAGVRVTKAELGDALHDPTQNWTKAAIAAQLHLRGLSTSAKTRAELVARLEEALHAEDAAEFESRRRTRRTALRSDEAEASVPT